MFTPIIERKIDEEVAKRKELKLFFQDNKPTNCEYCGKQLNSLPARCWGRTVEGWYESGNEDHECPKAPKVATVEQETGLSTDIRETADFVVFCQGTPCFITANERDQYVEGIKRGIKIIVVRNYTFDRIYSMIPYSEWRENEERHKRKAEQYMLIEDGTL